MPKTQTKKTKVTVNRHRYMLRTDSGNVAFVTLTVPAFVGASTDFEFFWLRSTSPEDLAAYAVWKNLLAKDFSQSVGREMRLKMLDPITDSKTLSLSGLH